MKKTGMALFVIIFVLAALGTAGAASFEMPLNPERDPKGTDVHMAYEWATFDPGPPMKLQPGAYLGGPGDSYRYTIIMDDKHANNPDYEILNAVVGVHIDDYDWSKESGDAKPEWGSILVNGKPMEYPILFPSDKRKPGSSGYVEIVSDPEISAEGGPLMPPYIFNITGILKRGEQVVIEVTNLRKGGSVYDKDAPFGDFVINRIGSHVWYKKK